MSHSAHSKDTPKLLGTLNNCGLHALTPSIKKEVDRLAQIQIANEQISETNDYETGYDRLKKCFAQFYGIPEKELDWKKFSELLQKFNEYETQLVLGPVLREFMKHKLTQQNPENPAQKIKEYAELQVLDGRYKPLAPSEVADLVARELGICVKSVNASNQVVHDDAQQVSNPAYTITLHANPAGNHWELSNAPPGQVNMDKTFAQHQESAGDGTEASSKEALDKLKIFVKAISQGQEKLHEMKVIQDSSSSAAASPAVLFAKEIQAYDQALRSMNSKLNSNPNKIPEKITVQFLEKELKNIPDALEKAEDVAQIQNLYRIKQLATRYKELLEEQDKLTKEGKKPSDFTMLISTQGLKTIQYHLAEGFEVDALLLDDSVVSGAAAGSIPGFPQDKPYPIDIPRKASVELEYKSGAKIKIHPRAEKVTFDFDTGASKGDSTKRYEKNNSNINACVDQALLLFEQSKKLNKTLELDFSNLHGVLRDNCKQQIITKIIHKYEAAGKDAGDKQRRYKEIVNALLKGGSMSDHEYMRYGIKANSSERDLRHKNVEFADYKGIMDDRRNEEAIKNFLRNPGDKGEESKWYQTNTDYKYWKWSEPKWEKRVQHCFYQLSQPSLDKKTSQKLRKELSKYGFEDSKINEALEAVKKHAAPGASPPR